MRRRDPGEAVLGEMRVGRAMDETREAHNLSLVERDERASAGNGQSSRATSLMSAERRCRLRSSSSGVIGYLGSTAFQTAA